MSIDCKKPPRCNFLKFIIPNSEIAAFMKSIGLKNSTPGNITKISISLKNVFPPPDVKWQSELYRYASVCQHFMTKSSTRGFLVELNLFPKLN